MVMTQSGGKPMVTEVGARRDCFLIQIPLWLDPKPLGAHDTQRIRHGLGKIMQFLVALKRQGRHGHFCPCPQCEDGAALAIHLGSRGQLRGPPQDAGEGHKSLFTRLWPG